MTISKRTVKKLWFAGGNQCAHPDCEQELIDYEEDTVVGRMSHIRARKKGGPRYDPEMSEEERNAYENLILLCPTHHILVDESPDKYPPDVLQRWKHDHERGSYDTPELSPDHIEQLLADVRPGILLAHVKPEELDILSEVLDWEPTEKHPQDDRGLYPIGITFDNLKDLLNRSAVPVKQQIDGQPMYKHHSTLSEEEYIEALAAAAAIADESIQYYQVEGSRREAELLDSNKND